MDIRLPDEIRHIIDRLEANRFEAYIVGGCVRDSLRGDTPKDWDVCTSALPEQIAKVFAGENIIETGLKHGTLTLVLNHIPFEITTYRSDGKYTDNRHPDTVEFLDDIKGDLSRRDFTINAMAYNPQKGIVDFFNGADDLRLGILKCVGEPDKRFREDALRILRAMRFASVLGMSIEENTAEAMSDNRKLLKKISSERIAGELNKLIVGAGAYKVFIEYAPILFEIIPELTPTPGFKQNNIYHCYDVFTHTLKSVDNSPKDLVIRLTMLLHDIGKPACHSHEDGVDHFYGHPKISLEIAGRVLSRLKYDNNTARAVKKLVLYHDADLTPSSKHIKRWLNKIGEERFRQLIEVKKADTMAQSVRVRQVRLDTLYAVSELLDEIVLQKQCFSLKGLAITGRDLIETGVPQGPQLGKTLKLLVDMVIDEQVENTKEELTKAVAVLFGSSPGVSPPSA